MKSPSSDSFARGLFAVSLALIAMVYGIVSSWWGWFPAPQIGEAHRTYLDVSRNWRNDIGLEPTRHLVAPNDQGIASLDRGYVHRPGTERAPATF